MPESTSAPLHVELDDETLRQWSDSFFPQLDVWYMDDSLADDDPRGGLILERKDYLAHPTFQDIHYVNAYLHWNMPRSVRWLLVADGGWIERQSEDYVHRLLARQVELERGMVFPVTHFDELPPTLERYRVGDKVVLGQAAWLALPDDTRKTLLLREQAIWDERECYPIPDGTPDHIRRIANRFGEVEGANCMATVAECVTGEQWLGHLWMHMAEFYNLMMREGYARAPRDTQPEPGDLFIFEKNFELKHAAYCLAPDRFVNKNGQSRFNPVRIVDFRMLRKDWRKAETAVYRRGLAQ